MRSSVFSVSSVVSNRMLFACPRAVRAVVELRTALLINFNVPLLRDGLKRISL